MAISAHDLVILMAVGIGVWLLLSELNSQAGSSAPITVAPVSISGLNALDLPTAPLSGASPSILTQAQVSAGLFGNPSGLQSATP